MSPYPTAFERGLRCLAHPWSLVAISLLLLNDHVLKHTVPSWWTGKLSDFAGLFFFPFLVMGLVGLVIGLVPRRGVEPSPTQVDPDVIARAAFALTAIWFASAKTIEPINGLTRDLVVALTGPGAVIVLDPTDLLALVMLWPAWRLWRSLDRHVLPRRLAFDGRRAIGFASMCVAALATMATTYGPPTYIETVAIDASGEVPTFYAAENDRLTWVYWSRDRGATWAYGDAREEGVPDGVTLQLATPVEVGQPVCVTDQPNICYRIAEPRSFFVEVTEDGGRSWEVAWRLPEGREHYMRRLLAEGSIMGRPSFLPGPYDLAIAPMEDGHAVLVAMGSEGGLVRDPDGAWRRVAIGSSDPTPARAASLLQALLVMAPEYWMSIACALVVFGAVQLRAYRRRRLAWLGLLLPLIGVVVFAALGARVGEDYVLTATAVLPVLAAMGMTALVITLGVAFTQLAVRQARAGTDGDAERRALLTRNTVLTSVAVAIVLWCPYVAWAMGWIEQYRSAVWGGSLFALMVLIVAWLGFGEGGSRIFAPHGEKSSDP